MILQPNKNSLKKFVSWVGVASASALLSLPAVALTNSDASSSNQVFNNSNARTDSTKLLAQSSRDNEPSTTGGTNRANERSSKGRGNRDNDMYRSADNDKRPMRAVTGGDSVQGIIWLCLNNPRCGRHSE